LNSVIGKWVRSLVQVQDGRVALGKIIEEQFGYFMHTPLGLGRDIDQLLELRSCNSVVTITSCLSNCTGDNDSIFYLNWWLTFSK
jgi:hypothetical protein